MNQPTIVTLRHWSGITEDVDLETARVFLKTGHWQPLSEIPPETAMLEPPENAMLPVARPRKAGPKKPRKRRER